MQHEEKEAFLKAGMFKLLEVLDENTPQRWGKMGPQQMMEHVADFFNVSTEKIIFPLVTPEEQLPKYREFLFSEKNFRENTKAPGSVLGEEPIGKRNKSYQEARVKLMDAVDHFFKFFHERPLAKTIHPVFGPLSFDEWVLLHYKHVTHHLRQFNLLT